MWENKVHMVFFEIEIIPRVNTPRTCMVLQLAELKHKLKCTVCTIFFSRLTQFEVYGVGAFLDRHNLQHMVLVQNRHAY